MMIRTILEYYAIICLILSPVTTAVMIYLYRKKNLSGLIDRFVDEKILGKGKAAPSGGPETGMEEGVPCLTMKPGDSYQCLLNELEISQIGQQFLWSSSSGFVGEVSEIGGLFSARRAGTTYIECGGQRIYKVRVRPRNGRWFADMTLNLLMERTGFEKARRTLKAKGYRTAVRGGGRYVSCRKWPEGGTPFKIGRGENGSLSHVLYRLKNTESIRRGILSEMLERMVLLPTDEGLRGCKDDAGTVSLAASRRDPKCYWAHHLEDAGEDGIDLTAFMKESHDGSLLFGMGASYRPGGTDNEFAQNPEMIERSFIGLLDGRDVPEFIGKGLGKNTEGGREEGVCEDKDKNDNVNNEGEGGTRKAEDGAEEERRREEEEIARIDSGEYDDDGDCPDYDSYDSEVEG